MKSLTELEFNLICIANAIENLKDACKDADEVIDEVVKDLKNKNDGILLEDLKCKYLRTLLRENYVDIARNADYEVSKRTNDILNLLQ